jgi:hypothetical protein
LGNPPGDDVGARFRATSDYATRNGFVGGFPNFHQANYGRGLVYGTFLFSADAAEWRDVPAAELGYPPGNDVGARFRATNDYANRHGFAGGFPNFYQADYGQGLVYGTLLIRHEAVEWRDVLADALGIFTNFTFDPAITGGQRDTLLERHVFAINRSCGCSNLKALERADLMKAYRKAIWHGINTNPKENASSTVGGNWIRVNFNVLFPQGQNEIAQTLIHEMMHCAGYAHPDRRDPDPTLGQSCSAPNTALFDCPFDGGPYYSTAVLQAEICIAGNQSDLNRVEEKANNEACSIDAKGEASLYLTPKLSGPARGE